MTSAQRRWLGGALVLSLLARLTLAAVVLFTRDDVTAFHTPDSALYLQLGAALARFDGFALDGTPHLFRVPGYPLLIAIADWLGQPTLATIGIQALLGVLITYLCFAGARLLGGTTAGIVAAWFYALEPGQWAWSAFVLTETLFTAMLMPAVVFGATYVATRRRSWLLLATILAAACAYVRVIGYVLPATIIATAGVLTLHRTSFAARPVVWRDLATAMLLATALLGTWHLRNGVLTGFWGFSTQFERAIFLTGSGVNDARNGLSYRDAVRSRSREMEQRTEAAGVVAAEMRRQGLNEVSQQPFAFAAVYSAGIVTTLVHPGTGAAIRLFRRTDYDTKASATQMLTLGQWRDGHARLREKTLSYWLLSVALGGIALLYVGAFFGAAWMQRTVPPVQLICVVAGVLLLASGGPDADSRRRAPLVPLFCVVAAPVLARHLERSPRSQFRDNLRS